MIFPGQRIANGFSAAAGQPSLEAVIGLPEERMGRREAVRIGANGAGL